MSPEIPLAVASGLVTSHLASSDGVGDPGASRTVYLTVAGLVAIAVALVVVGVWLVRQTRVDRELLAPLEEMDTRRWRRTDPVGRRRLLDEVRPNGAIPRIRTPERPEVDAEFGAASRPVDFDDLTDDRAGDVDGGGGEKDHDGSPVGPAGTGGAGSDPLLERHVDPAANDDEATDGDEVADEIADDDEVADDDPVVDDGEISDDGEIPLDDLAADDDACGDGAHDADVDEDDTGEVDGRDPLGDVEDLSAWPAAGIPGEGLLGGVASAEERPGGDG